LSACLAINRSTLQGIDFGASAEDAGNYPNRNIGAHQRNALRGNDGLYSKDEIATKVCFRKNACSHEEKEYAFEPLTSQLRQSVAHLGLQKKGGSPSPQVASRTDEAGEPICYLQNGR
jgi:hypothetical protein